MSRVVAAWVLMILSVHAASAAAPSPSSRPIALFLDDTSPATRATAAAGITASGGRVIHAFGDLLIVTLPAGSELSAYHLSGIREVALNGVTLSSRRPRPGSSFGVAAWNAIAIGRNPVVRDLWEPPPLEDDALAPP